VVSGVERPSRGEPGGHDAEIKAARPEYAEHRTSLDGFRKAASDAR
jgi:hypothetical protein